MHAPPQISIAYLTDPSLAFILFPRSSPLCTEIKVPNELRDRVSTESLVGALVRLKRPPIAMVAAPRSSPIDVTRSFLTVTLPALVTCTSCADFDSCLS